VVNKTLRFRLVVQKRTGCNKYKETWKISTHQQLKHRNKTMGQWDDKTIPNKI